MILAKTSSIYHLPRPPGIIFDFDGVLVDSLEAHLWAWNEATLQIFHKPLKNMNQLRGMSTRAIAGVIAKQFGQQKVAKDLARLKTQILIGQTHRIPLMTGVQDFLGLCQSIDLPIAIGSNSSKLFVQAVVDHHKLPVSIILGFEDVTKPKPHPDIFLACAKAMLIPKERWANIPVFEDSGHGLAAAKKAKMTPIGIASLHSAKELADRGALVVINNLSEVSLLLD